LLYRQQQQGGRQQESKGSKRSSVFNQPHRYGNSRHIMGSQRET